MDAKAFAVRWIGEVLELYCVHRRTARNLVDMAVKAGLDWENQAGLSDFLFAWRRGQPAFDKLPRVGGAGMGVVDKPETGPYFGPEDATIPVRFSRGCPEGSAAARAVL